MRDLQDLGSPPPQGVDQRSVRVATDTVKVPVVEELLKAPVDAVTAFVGEELEVLRRRDEAVIMGGAEEVEVAVLDGKRGTMGALGADESRKLTTERRSRLSGGRKSSGRFEGTRGNAEKRF